MLSLALLFAEEAVQRTEPGWAHFVPLIAMGVIFFWMISRARRQEKKQRETLLGTLKKNDKVLTNGGIIGIIASLKDNDDEVTLKVDESSNVRLRVVKSSIVRVLGAETGAKEQKEGGG
jgi:preprotein translocase subunit YajC